MGDQHQGGAKLGIQVKNQIDNGGPRRRVKITRRLVSKEDLGGRRKCSGYGNPLLFATGQLPRIVLHAVFKANPAQQLAGLRLSLRVALQFSG